MVRRAFRLLAIFTLFVSAPLAQTTSDYDILVQKGKAQLQAGTADLALASGEEAIKINADRWEGYALAGGALMNLKRYEEGADRLSQAISRAPEAKQAALRDLRRQCLLAESGAPAVSSQSGSVVQSQTAHTTQSEIVLWKTIENSQNEIDFEMYLSQYPNGALSALAKRHLSDLQAQGERQKEQQTAARMKEVPLFKGTLVRQGDLIFLALPRPENASTPFYMVTLNGEPAFVAHCKNKKKKSDGLVFFLRNQIIIRSGTETQTFSASDAVAISPHSAYWQYVKIRPRTTVSTFPELELGEDSDDTGITKFANLLLEDWDNTLQQFVAAGIDMKRLPDSQTFDIKRASSTWDVRQYCMCTLGRH
jgi:tetratricopeptide (TPR) repeat protein